MYITGASLVDQMVKNLPAMQQTQAQSLGQEYSPGEGNGNPLQYSCLANSMGRGAWWATVHGIAKSHNLTDSLQILPIVPLASFVAKAK